MTETNNNKISGPAGVKNDRTGWLVALGAMAAAAVARLPALGAWWNQDDWGLLARAAGLATVPEWPIRWLSQVAYWQVFWPLAGLDPMPYAASRLVMHALAAGGVVRLAGRLDLVRSQQWLAGLIMAATPLAFSALYWAAGVQDLLAVVCVVWSLERWLAPGRGNRLLAAALAAGAVTAKETAVGLPLLLIWLLIRESSRPTDRHRLAAWSLVAVTAVAAAANAWLALRFFSTAANEPYAIGGVGTVANNFGLYGLWLLSPGPRYQTNPGLAAGAAGGLLWLVWAGWSLVRWRRGDKIPGFTLAGALVMVAPLLPLRHHLAPDLAYPVEPFGSLALACLWPRRWTLKPVVTAGLVLACVAWGFFGMRGRLALRDAAGLLADPLVLRTAVSAAAVQHLRHLPLHGRTVVILQPPLSRPAAAMAAKLGENWVTGSLLYNSLGGAWGPRLVVGHGTTVRWANGLLTAPADAFVLLDGGRRVEPWGDIGQALLYQTLTDLGAGLFERARDHLLRASRLAGQYLSLSYSPELLPLSLDAALANRRAFHAFLDESRGLRHTDADIEAVRINLDQLLRVCAGRDLDD